MVGKNAEALTARRRERQARAAKTSFAAVVKQFIEEPFVPGGKTQGGFDCLGFVYAFFVAWGKGDKLITVFGDLDLTNYHCAYPDMTPDEIKDRLMEIYEANGREIKLGWQIAGDALIVETPQGVFPAIYAGNGNILSSFRDAGVRVVKLTKDMKILNVRRVD